MKKEFCVPSGSVKEFSDLLVENELVNEIIDSTDNDEVIIEVNYRSSQKGAILDLIEWLDENITEDDVDDDDNDDQDDDESDKD
jgi:hypothetical protein